MALKVGKFLDKFGNLAWIVICACVVVPSGYFLLSLKLAHPAQASQLVMPAAASSSSFQPWKIGCVDCPRRFQYMTDHSLRLDSSGHPHIAYGGDNLYYAWFDGVAWQSEIVDSSLLAGYTASLVLSSNDIPHIAYFVMTPLEELRYAYKDTSGWHIITVDTIDSYGSCSLDLDAAGNAHISYYGNSSLNYAVQDGSSWSLQVVEPDAGMQNSLRLDSSGYAHISYAGWNGTNEDLKYAYQDANGWHFKVLDSSTIIYGTSLALDGSHCAHISYLDINSANYAHQTSCQGDGTWQLEMLAASEIGFASTSIALDSSSYPHMSFITYDYHLRYTFQDSTGWHTITPATTPNGSEFTSLSMENNGTIHIAYTDGDNLYHIYQTNSTWEKELIDQGGSIGLDGGLAMDKHGQLHIAYFSSMRPGMTYATQAAGGWDFEQVPDIATADLDMALDEQGYPHFCLENTAGWLAYSYQDAAGWHTTAIGISGDSEGCSIAMDSQGYAHIIYFSAFPRGESWYYLYQDAAGWNSKSLSYIGYSYALALDVDGYAHILKISGDLEYLHQDANGWTETSLASGGFHSAAIALDALGYPHIICNGSDYSLQYLSPRFFWMVYRINR